MPSLRKGIGIDVGQTGVRVWIRGEGMFMEEPGWVAVAPGSSFPVAFGREAQDLVEASVGRLRLAGAVHAGTLPDPRLAGAMVERLVRLARGRRPPFRPDVAICLPAGASTTVRLAVTAGAVAGGARNVWLVDEVIAAALGAGVPAGRRRPVVVCDVGAGGTRMAVLAEYATLGTESGPGGDDVSAALAERLGVTATEAERLKIRTGAASGPGGDGAGGGTGRSEPEPPAKAFEPWLKSLADHLRALLALTQARAGDPGPEGPVMLTGGGARLAGLAGYLESSVGQAVAVADRPETCAVRGAAMAFGMLPVLKRPEIHIG